MIKVAVTGAAGFIGAHLCRALEAKPDAFEVIRWIRTPETSRDRRCILPDVIDERCFQENIDVLVHLAYVTRFKNAEETQKINLQGSQHLFHLAKKHGVKMIFVSSMGAHPEAQSWYGRTKYQLEQALARDFRNQSPYCIIKPGLVIGDGGLFERMVATLEKVRFAPLFWGGQQPLQTVSIEDLIQGMMCVLFQEKVGTYHMVESEAHPIKDFYFTLMKHLKIKPRLVSLPGDMVLKLVRWMEYLGIHLPITSDNLLGLKHPYTFASDFSSLGIQPLSMEASIKKICSEAYLR